MSDTTRRPEDVEQSALEVNTVEATEGQKLQAEVEINQDPVIPATNPDAQAEPGAYDDLKLDELREELKGRDLPTSGNKAELIARLVEADNAKKVAPADQTVNGGIKTDRVYTEAHASTLQELSDARRAAQLKAVGA